MGKCGAAFLALCLLGPVVSSGQSLAEVARKERERRAQTADEEPRPPVISERDLESARGGSLSITGARSEVPRQGEKGGGEPEASRKLTAKEIRDLRGEWARIWEEQMRQAEEDLERARNDVYQCRSAERYFFVPLAVDCVGVDLRLASAEARLKRVRSNRYNWELLLPESPNP